MADIVSLVVVWSQRSNDPGTNGDGSQTQCTFAEGL